MSSTRWNKYGTFTAKFQSGSSAPGIVTAFLLSNPALGEEISFEITGQDPKKIITNYYRRVRSSSSSSHEGPHDGNPHVLRSHLVSHEETIPIKKDTSTKELVYKIEWTESMIRWSVDGKVLRTVYSKDPILQAEGGFPENEMQLQLTIWDAGYATETKTWAGGETNYGEDNMNEFIMAVDSVEITCKDPKEGQKPWPGPEAWKRLSKAKQEAAARAKRYQKYNKQGGGIGGMFSSTAHFFEIAILSLIKWTCVLLALVCGAAYFTAPKSRSTASRTAASSTGSSQNLGLQ